MDIVQEAELTSSPCPVRIRAHFGDRDGRDAIGDLLDPPRDRQVAPVIRNAKIKVD
jgi:hypothetical protein